MERGNVCMREGDAYIYIYILPIPPLRLSSSMSEQTKPSMERGVDREKDGESDGEEYGFPSIGPLRSTPGLRGIWDWGSMCVEGGQERGALLGGEGESAAWQLNPPRPV